MQWVQMFDDGSASQRDLLGGKGANLAEMTRMGLPVPPGFTITTQACRASMQDQGRLPAGLLDEVRAAVHELEERRGATFGSADAPLLISVRSGAKFSMPGMMDTVLNLGLTPAALPALAARTDGGWFAQDARRRLLDQFSRVVLDVPEEVIAEAGARLLAEQGVDDPSGLDTEGLEELSKAYEDAIRAHAGRDFPWDPWEQLEMAIAAVFRSWNGRRAQTYRRLNDISDDLGTAVNIQVMVFGNAGENSGTGVAFTRDPATGENEPFGDFLLSAQGEDVVAGIRNTEPLARLADHFPACDRQLHQVFARLEQRYRDMCDIEFTIEEGELFILQTRVGKRSATAALRMAVEMVDEGLIDADTAVGRFSTEQLDRLLHPRFDPDADFTVVTTGLGASPGAASGRVVFTADEAESRAHAGEDVILVRDQTSPEDLHGLVAARGVLTSRGGLVSHAAVVARGIGTPAVCGAAEVVIDHDAALFRVGDVVVADGDVVSIDG
ncbi:MAG TPA: pyruvate, phosphate dikinase, partial [Nitriliruptoraceae bacterium]|nr:pyruvate, phosphate dikinase [Nitriliruptoraceae bacterium]